jgi:hypothetical protein
MIADYNTMPHMFWECNRLYFGHQLRKPQFGLMHTFRYLGKFEYRWGEKKKPVKKRYMAILMSDFFDFDEETFRNIMVHEMIHYYLYLNGTSDCSVFSRFLRFVGFKNSDHGPEFMAMAQKLNEQYGLNITKTCDASSIPLAPHKFYLNSLVV